MQFLINNPCKLMLFDLSKNTNWQEVKKILRISYNKFLFV